MRDKIGARHLLVWPLAVASVFAARLPVRSMLPYPDAVTYVRLAEYYASGQFDLAVSGYFGPLFTWLMVPFVLGTMTPIDAARVAMGISAIVFVIGCAKLFASFDLPNDEFILATILSASAAAAWAFRDTTPDLLLSGLMCLALAQTWSASWPSSTRRQLAAGVLWGVAYLAKAVAIPIAAAVLVAVSVRFIVARPSAWKGIAVAVATTALGMLLIASPWIGLISHKYGRLTFSTSARINHAIAGPSDVDRDHPVARTFHVPEAGRVTVWEDPTRMDYKYWSPFDSIRYAVHQAKLMYWNAYRVVDAMGRFDRLGFGMTAAFLGFILARPWRRAISDAPWRWAAVLIAALAAPYLPVYAQLDRYYEAAYPLLAIAGLRFVSALAPAAPTGFRWRRALGLAGVFVSMVQDPTAWRSADFITGTPDAYAEQIAVSLKRAGIVGPVAGAGKDAGWPGGEHAHFYVAYFLNQPDYGAEATPTPDRCVSSGASLLVVPRNTLVARDLSEDPRFEDLDATLFSRWGQPIPPLKVFAIHRDR